MPISKDGIETLLKSLDISYELVCHPAVYTIDQMLALDLPHPEDIVKNLFLRDAKKRNYYLLCIKEDKHADLKKFRQLLGSTPLSFASEADLAAILSLEKGSVTPFGILNDEECMVQVFFDRDFCGGKMGVHPNENTATIWLDADDLFRIIVQHGNPVKWIDL